MISCQYGIVDQLTPLTGLPAVALGGVPLAPLGHVAVHRAVHVAPLLCRSGLRLFAAPTEKRTSLDSKFQTKYLFVQEMFILQRNFVLAYEKIIMFFTKFRICGVISKLLL